MNTIRVFLATTVLALATHAAAEIVYLPYFPTQSQDVKAESNPQTQSATETSAE